MLLDDWRFQNRGSGTTSTLWPVSEAVMRNSQSSNARRSGVKPPRASKTAREVKKLASPIEFTAHDVSVLPVGIHRTVDRAGGAPGVSKMSTARARAQREAGRGEGEGREGDG